MATATMSVTFNATTEEPYRPPHYVDELKQANKIIQSSILAFIMVAMGCVMSIKDIKATVSWKLMISRFYVLEIVCKMSY